MKKDGRKKHGLLRTVISALITAAVILGAVWVVLNWDTVKQPVYDRLKKTPFGSSGESFAFEPYSDSVFAELDGGLVVSSAAETDIFDRNGRLKLNKAYGPEQPVISTGGAYAAVWSVGGEEIFLFHDAKYSVINCAAPLVSAEVDADGNVAAVTAENGYHGAVNVYRDDGTAVYRVYLGTGYPMDAALSPGGDGLAVLTVTDTGSRVALYSLGSEEEKASCELEEKVFFDIAYMPGDRLCAVSQQGAVFLDRTAKIVNTADFGGEYLKDYALDRDGCAVFVLGKYRTGSKGRIMTLDSYGNTLGSLDISAEPHSISIKGRYIAAQYNDSVVIYDRELNEYAGLNNAAGVKGALVRGDGTAIIILGNGAAVFEP